MNIKQERLFFALMPPEEVKTEIANLVSNLEISDQKKKYLSPKTKVVVAENYHITLLFLGNVRTDLIPIIQEYVKDIKVSDFKLMLNALGYFKQSHVLWIGSNQIPEQLHELYNLLVANLNNLSDQQDSEDAFLGDLKINTRSKFTPHITIYKKISNPNLISNYIDYKSGRFNIPWDVDSFFLIRSVFVNNNVEYEVVAEFG